MTFEQPLNFVEELDRRVENRFSAALADGLLASGVALREWRRVLRMKTRAHMYRTNPPCEWCFRSTGGIINCSPSYTEASKHYCSGLCSRKAWAAQ